MSHAFRRNRYTSLIAIAALALSMLVFTAPAARADTVNIAFSFTNEPGAGGNFAGTVSGIIYGVSPSSQPAADIVITSIPNGFPSVFLPIPLDLLIAAPQPYFFAYTASGGLTGGAFVINNAASLIFILDAANGFATLSLDKGVTEITSNSFTYSVLPSPEPSSFALLGTGLLGALGAIRRRMRV